MKIVRQIEALYRKDAEQQVQAVQRNALVDYRGFKWLQRENARLTDLNENYTDAGVSGPFGGAGCLGMDICHRRCADWWTPRRSISWWGQWQFRL